MLILRSLHGWENTSNSKTDKHPSHWRPSLPALQPRCCHRWSECYCPDAGRCFSEFSQLTPPNLFAAMWQFARACTFLLFRHNTQMPLACNYSHITLSIIDSSPGGRAIYIAALAVTAAICYLYWPDNSYVKCTCIYLSSFLLGLLLPSIHGIDPEAQPSSPWQVLHIYVEHNILIPGPQCIGGILHLDGACVACRTEALVTMKDPCIHLDLKWGEKGTTRSAKPFLAGFTVSTILAGCLHI